MPSRNIAVRKDMYDILGKDRRAGESFTKVLIRLLNQKGPLEEIVGLWGGHSSRREGARWLELRHGRLRR
jgi:predicted CopG family antitoxin